MKNYAGVFKYFISGYEDSSIIKLQSQFDQIFYTNLLEQWTKGSQTLTSTNKRGYKHPHRSVGFFFFIIPLVCDNT